VTGPAVQARGMRRIALRINGRAREGRADPRRTLADFLRHDHDAPSTRASAFDELDPTKWVLPLRYGISIGL